MSGCRGSGALQCLLRFFYSSVLRICCDPCGVICTLRHNSASKYNRSDVGATLMSTFRRVFSSSVGTKLLIGLTGLALFAYLILHLAGNALIFAGPETFNEYSHALVSNPLILPIEIGLLAIFLLHVNKAVTNYFANR